MSSNDLENLAITSLLAGMVGAIFVLFGMQSDGISFVGMLAGACAVAAGVRVLRGEASNKKLAVTGTVMGTIAVCFWILAKIFSAALFLLRLL